MAFANLPWMAYAVIAVSALGGVTMPAVNTLTSNLTPRNAQGELQGAQASIMAMTLIFSPVMMSQTLKAFSVDSAPIYFPGAAFLLASIMTACAIVPFLIGAGVNRRALAAAATKPPAAE
jgi:DHA1 family tetracycline resistance protein-like MFS transporter